MIWIFPATTGRRCIDFPAREWQAWYERYTQASDREYFFVETPAGEVVGHAHYRVADRTAAERAHARAGFRRLADLRVMLERPAAVQQP